MSSTRHSHITLFNLQDTTSIMWWWKSKFESLHFGSILMSATPMWEMSSGDSLRWRISHRLWNLTVDNRERNTINTLMVTDELLSVMQKDYSMLQRFPEFYE